ncbi:MAG TPA: hypothetical protein HPQ04_11260 [Rhodospirillaceae bacterium]|nr:hypothetical protein [Rhodospirillaceae bacterium]
MEGYSVIDGVAPGGAGMEIPGGLAHRHPSQAGAIGGLSDTALAVVVGTLTLVGVVGFFQSASTSAKTNSEIANLTALVANIRSAYYQAGADYSTIAAAVLASGGIAPQPLIFNGGLRSMFGQAITVAATASNSQFTVTYTGIPESACVKFVSTVWNTVPSILATTINATAPASYDMAGATGATGGCAAGKNTIVFTSD